MVLITVLATPFAMAVAQSPRSATAREHGCEMRNAKIKNPTARERALQRCTIVPNPPGDDDGSGDGGWGGLSGIQGQVFEFIDQFPGLPGWVVTISGPVASSSVTDAEGRYAFAGLPEGTYTVCLQAQSGWTETFPTWGATCSGGAFGYEFPLQEMNGAGSTASGVNFGLERN